VIETIVCILIDQQVSNSGVAGIDVVEFDGNSANLMTTGNYSMTASREPVTSSPPSATMIDDSHDKNDVEVTSPVDDNKTKKKTRKKQKSSVKPEETGEQVATVEQVDKGFHFCV